MNKNERVINRYNVSQNVSYIKLKKGDFLKYN